VTGVYVKAFCSGVQEIMTEYKEHILAIEQEYLKDRALTIGCLQQKLGVFYSTFPALLNVMDEIEDQGLKGGELLDVLF